ncbi:MAG: inositol monophosphatase [Actinomycetota bacterium]|nr:inositol monophosphatase [Actinomycetota bacterium]
MADALDPRDAETLLELAEQAARQAAELLKGYYDERIVIEEKASARDLVSVADFEAERLIVGIIHGDRPSDTIIGEEFGRRAGTSGLVWGIDPLDGTSNFLAGIPHWAICIGCEDEAGSLVGVILDPNRDEMFSAARGLGATLNGKRIHASSCESLASAMAAFGPAWGEGWHEHRMALSDRLLDAIAHGRQMGSLAVDLAWTAAGRFDFFYYDSDLNPWDVAARVIAEEAGLITEILPEEPGAPGALVATPPALHDEVHRLLERTTITDGQSGVS